MSVSLNIEGRRLWGPSIQREPDIFIIRSVRQIRRHSWNPDRPLENIVVHARRVGRPQGVNFTIPLNAHIAGSP